MLTRRALLILSTATVLLAPLGAARAQGSDPTAFVIRLGDDLVSIVNGAGSYEDKRRRLVPLIETAVDVDAIAQFCLGRFWRTATPPQRQEYTELFRAVLLNNITGRLGQFQGVSFTPTTTAVRDGNSAVGTTIRRPNQQPNAVQWIVSQSTGAPKIIDVVAEGVSLRLTQRNDYAAVLGRNNNDVGALIAAMRQQAGR
ncbi:MAG: ABC transporter substrate-binding protein [Gemmatimonadaceae bacterium]|nr:ABC transporter substrate-binding protein [Acetobacteraceae bacterium]